MAPSEIQGFWPESGDFTAIVQRLYKALRGTRDHAFMRVAIVHYWLLNMRGGEKVLEALCRLLPDADIFTLFYDPDKVSPVIRSRRVHASFLQPLRKHYR